MLFYIYHICLYKVYCGKPSGDVYVSEQLWSAIFKRSVGGGGGGERMLV